MDESLCYTCTFKGDIKCLIDYGFDGGTPDYTIINGVLIHCMKYYKDWVYTVKCSNNKPVNLVSLKQLHYGLYKAMEG